MVRVFPVAALLAAFLLAGCAGNGASSSSSPEPTTVNTTGTADGNPLKEEPETVKPEPVRISETHDLSQGPVGLSWNFTVGPGMKQGHVNFRLEALASASGQHATATDDACFTYVVERNNGGSNGSQCSSDSTPAPSNIQVGSGVTLYAEDGSGMAAGDLYEFTFTASRSAANLVVDILVEY
ncbi:MAG: hypothetical protein AABX89_05480 [Candidatus Thermoplasmatota archaeon]